MTTPTEKKLHLSKDNYLVHALPGSTKYPKETIDTISTSELPVFRIVDGAKTIELLIIKR